MKYDVVSNSSKVIMDELSFANGIVLSPDEDFLLVRKILVTDVSTYLMNAICTLL